MPLATGFRTGDGPLRRDLLRALGLKGPARLHFVMAPGAMKPERPAAKYEDTLSDGATLYRRATRNGWIPIGPWTEEGVTKCMDQAAGVVVWRK